MFFDNFAAIRPAPTRRRCCRRPARRWRTRGAPTARRAATSTRRTARSTLLDRLLYADMKTYLVELLMKQDQMSMAASIESRVPFLDHKLVEFAAALPDAWKLRGFTTKWMLREAMKATAAGGDPRRGRRWDSRCRSRGWMRGAAGTTSSRDVLLDRARARARHHRSRGGRPRCSTATRPARADGGDALWSLLNLELWYRTFIDGEGMQTLPIACTRRSTRRRRSRTWSPSWEADGMKILWLNAGLLLPLDKGGKLRTWHLMRHLARAPRDHLSRRSRTRRSRRPIATGCARCARELETVPRGDAGQGHAGASTPTRRATSSIRCPTPSRKYRSRGLSAQRLDALLASGRFDLVVCDFLSPVGQPAGAAALPGGAVHAQRRSGDLAAPRGDRRPTRSRGACSRQQWRRMLRFEAAGARAVRSACWRCRTPTAQTFARLYPGHPARAGRTSCQTGVDTDVLRAGARRAGAPRTLVFTGSMDWLPNEDGMQFFCRDILPRIRAGGAGGDAVSIVGRAPTPAVQAARRGCRASRSPAASTTCGRTSRAAAVYVVPLRIGGGTRLKIFEAMAMGKAVVSTTVGAEGLPVTDGQHIVHRRRAGAFARRGRAPDARRRGAPRRSRPRRGALVVEHYDWSAVAGDFEAALLRTPIALGRERPRVDRVRARPQHVGDSSLGGQASNESFGVRSGLRRQRLGRVVRRGRPHGRRRRRQRRTRWRASTGAQPDRRAGSTS